MTHTFSQQIFIDVKTKLSEADVFSVLSMNIRSLGNNLQMLIDQCLTDNDKCYDMGFSETRLDNIESLYALKCFDMYTMNRDRTGGGVCLYVFSIYSSCVVM